MTTPNYRERLAWALYQRETGDPAPYIPGDWPGTDSERCFLRQADLAITAIEADRQDPPTEPEVDASLRGVVEQLVTPGPGSLLERVPAPFLNSKSRDALVWAQGILGQALHSAPAGPPAAGIREGLDVLQAQVTAWRDRELPGNRQLVLNAGKVCEEAGELMGAVIKGSEPRADGIDWDERRRQETGDVLIALCAVAQTAGESLGDLVAARWSTVSKRRYATAASTT